ncbi:hypothetical protein LY622_19725 [Halomonas sp. M5N1S17]|uniref:hypothetical protein n=1 Tax=Halomonas alkalisoli TaxID=2907158 RepID=UPI001F274FEA|nr:hypothetical protein [Halomonas alkalisoli]MCE9665656.1 hypothetical protein [Halomonas alkalisoli]
MNRLALEDIAAAPASRLGALSWVGMEQIALRVVHAESLHAHDAVARSEWNWGGSVRLS